MKKFSRFLLFVLTIGTLLLSACGAASATPNVGSSKVEAAPIAFLGLVDSIAGDQWVINGQTITVDPAIIRDGPFSAGDQVKVEGVVNADGSFTISRVETPTSQDVSSLPPFGNDNSNSANGNDSNVNDANVNTNINDDNSDAVNSNDANTDNGTEVNSNEDNSNVANSNDTNVNDDNGTNSNNDNGSSVNSNSNANDDQSSSGGNDNNSGGGGNGNGGGNDGSEGGNDNGGGED